MGKSYHKSLRVGICTGSNTEYYRNKRRSFRAKWKSNLKRALKGKVDEEYCHPEDTIQFKNTWDEPTDGSFLYTSKDFTDRNLEVINKTNSWKKELYEKFKRKLKHFKKK